MKLNTPECYRHRYRGSMHRWPELLFSFLAVLVAPSCAFDVPPDIDFDADPRDASRIDSSMADASPGIDAEGVDAGECVPDSVVCAAGHYVDCSPTGTIEVALECVLGCDTVEPRCRDVDPSNGLAVYLDQARTDAAAPDLVLAEGSTINTTTGNVLNAGVAVAVPTELVGGHRVFIVKSLSITGTVTVSGFEGLVIVSDGDIGITATLDVSANAGIDGPGGGAGTCEGGTSTTAGSFSGGGGGAGNGDLGAGGGLADGVAASPGGTSGPSLSDQALVPLRGGCRGGRATENTSTCSSGRGGGGGAVQLVSRGSISLTGSGAIDASGGGGVPSVAGTGTCTSTSARGGGGGGSGGSVLLEAPEIVLTGAGVTISTNGGGGAAGGVTLVALFGADGGTQAGQAPGGVNASTGSNGGPGGISTTAPGPGLDGGANEDGGGGGGAVGRVRFNTTAGTVVPTGGATIRSKFSNGSLGTRLVP